MRCEDHGDANEIGVEFERRDQREEGVVAGSPVPAVDKLSGGDDEEPDLLSASTEDILLDDCGAPVAGGARDPDGLTGFAWHRVGYQVFANLLNCVTVASKRSTGDLRLK